MFLIGQAVAMLTREVKRMFHLLVVVDNMQFSCWSLVLFFHLSGTSRVIVVLWEVNPHAWREQQHLSSAPASHVALGEEWVGLGTVPVPPSVEKKARRYTNIFILCVCSLRRKHFAKQVVDEPRTHL